MLVVTTTVGMVHGVHSHTTSTGPVVTLSPVFVVSTTGLEQRLVDTSTTSDDSNSRPRTAADGLLRTRWQPDPGLVVVGAVSNDGSVVAGSPGEGATVTDLLLDVADDGTLGALADGEDVSDGESRLFAAVDEGAGVHALGGDESLLAELEAVGVTEDDTGEGSTTSSVVNDLLYDSTNISVTLSEIEGTELCGVLVVVGVRFEDSVRSPLSPDNPTHCVLVVGDLRFSRNG